MALANSPSEHPRPAPRPRIALWAVFVALASAAIYLPTLSAKFILLDDPQYTTDNAYILYPSWSKLTAFFTEVFAPSTVGGYYQPLTMASLMLDRVVQAWLVGGYLPSLDPFNFHLTNILLHGCNAALVFLLCHGITKRIDISVFGALLFAAHPANVEVVAWVCQRKALLSTFFALAMLLSYARFARSGRRRWLAATTAAFFLSLLAKPTGMFLPLVLLVADVWPLRRWSRQSIIEKWPLYLLAIAGGWIAFVSQAATSNMVENAENRPLSAALLIACHNIAFYLGKAIAPIGLCPQYPLPPEGAITLAHPTFAWSVAMTAGWAVVALWAVLRRRVAIWATMAAFLLMIGPAIGSVRFASTIAADRFLYLPLVALIVLVAHALRYAIGDAPAPMQQRRSICVRLGCVCLLGLLSIVTIRQQAVWHDSIAMYQAVVDRYPASPLGRYGLGSAYLNLYEQQFARSGETSPSPDESLLDRAMEEYRRAAASDPGYSAAYYRMGHILMRRGRTAEGITMIQQGLSQQRADPMGYYFLGLAYTSIHDDSHAILAYQECLPRQPSSPIVRLNLANALLRTGRAAEALPHYRRLSELNPTDLDGLQNWAVALLTVGQPQEAIDRLRQVVSFRSRIVETSAGSRRDEHAGMLADARYTLAAALAAVGEEAGAIDQLRSAIESKPELAVSMKANAAFAKLRESRSWRDLRESPTQRVPN